jgi:hypothetical protein
MKSRLFLFLLVPLLVRGAVPPAEKLLPADTLVVATVPDMAKARGAFTDASLVRLWLDPELRPFREKFLDKFKTDLVEPLERQLGIKFADYLSVAQGQLTLALTRTGWDVGTNNAPGIVVLLDTKDKSDALRTNLADLRKKWVDAGKQTKTEKIRDIEFTTLIISKDDISSTLKGALPKAGKGTDAAEEEEEAEEGETGESGANTPAKTEITFGQSDSLLLVGTSAQDLEKVLVRQSGGSVAALADQAVYDVNHNAFFRDAIAFAWVHVQPIADLLMKAGAKSEDNPRNPMALKPEKVIEALGVRNLKTLALNLNTSNEGALVNVFLGAPESDRRGIFKILAVKPQDANPPAFVPATVEKFNRWRLDGQKTWTAVEAMLLDISPQMGGFLQLMFNNLGKDKDPDFDFKKAVIGNLGDDFITYQKPARGTTPVELESPPTITLIGSPSPEQLVTALRTVSSMIPSESGGVVKEREFLGKKIFSIQLPPVAVPGSAKPLERALNFSSSGGYLALSLDAAMLEEFLRSSESKEKALRETAGLDEAAQKVGGMSTGLFGYENSAESARTWFEAAKRSPDKPGKSLNPVSGLPLGAAADSPELKEWFDFSLLPPFERVAKYFHFSVFGGSANADGLSFKFYSPTPPQLRK